MRSTIAISVGCNVNGRPYWDGAYVKDRLEDTVYDACHTDYSADPEPICHTFGPVAGSWEGVPEVTILWAGTVPTAFLPQIRRSLAFLAKELQQEAIGFICQPDTETLIGPARKGTHYSKR